MPGTVIYQAHPAMFRAHPLWFILYILLIAALGIGFFILRASDSKLLYELSPLLIVAFGIGIIILLYWYIKTRATALTVTDSELMYVRGILSKDRTAKLNVVVGGRFGPDGIPNSGDLECDNWGTRYKATRTRTAR